MFPKGELLERRFLPCYRFTEDHTALVASYYNPEEIFGSLTVFTKLYSQVMA